MMRSCQKMKMVTSTLKTVGQQVRRLLASSRVCNGMRVFLATGLDMRVLGIQVQWLQPLQLRRATGMIIGEE